MFCSRCVSPKNFYRSMRRTISGEWRARVAAVSIYKVMGRHDRLHQQLVHVQREMGGPGNPNPDPRMEMHFNMLFKSKLAAEVLILVSFPCPVLSCPSSSRWATQHAARPRSSRDLDETSPTAHRWRVFDGELVYRFGLSWCMCGVMNNDTLNDRNNVDDMGNPQDQGILADSLMFMVKAGSWLTEFVSKEVGVDVDSSEHESSSQSQDSLAGLSQVIVMR